jgi:peroxiredoxin
MKTLPFFLVFSALLAFGFTNTKRHPLQLKASDLPSFEITLLSGTKTPVNKLTGKIALVLFQPDCDHCQREAEQIRQNLPGFKDFKIYFISSASAPEIDRFAKEYKLSAVPNVFFGQTSAQNIVNAFGPIEAPSIYLYSASGSLIEKFNGEVAIEVVLKYIKPS